MKDEGRRDHTLNATSRRPTNGVRFSYLSVCARQSGRRTLACDSLIRGDYGVTPMIFQYNPLAYCLETNDKGELLATMSPAYHIAPKVRYNIHDRGHVLRFQKLVSQLETCGRLDLLEGLEGTTDLPLLFLYGRSDMSVDFYGANVTPDSLHEVLYGIDALAPVLNTFRLLAYENERHDKCGEVAVERTDGAEIPDDSGDLAKIVFSRLAKINGDFFNAYCNTAPPGILRSEVDPRSGTAGISFLGCVDEFDQAEACGEADD